MTYNVEEEFDKFYDELMSKPLSILHIFEDYYSEDRVELQKYSTREELIDKLSRISIRSFIGNSFEAVERLSKYEEYSQEDKDVIKKLWFEDEVYENGILHNGVIAHYFLSILREYIIGLISNDAYILIYFPKVRISNEYDKYVDVKDIWVKVWIRYDGKSTGYFGMNRSHYPLSHFACDYLHSHISSIPRSDFTYFATPCTGTGPINYTMTSLTLQYDEALWSLACLEIDRFVRTESIEGGPYHRLEGINNGGINAFTTYPLSWVTHNSQYGKGISPILKDFIKHLLDSDVLKFNYSNGSFGIGMSSTDTVITVSNEFIKFYNKEYFEGRVSDSLSRLKSAELIKDAKIIGGTIYYISGGSESNLGDYSEYVGSKVCNFKGKTITVSITSISDEEINSVLLLNPHIVAAIIGSLLRILNYNYGREEDSETSSVKRVRYF